MKALNEYFESSVSNHLKLKVYMIQ